MRPLLARPKGVTYSGRFHLPEPHLAHAKAKLLRDKLASRYDEATSYSMPGRDGILAGPDQGEIYDDTAMLAVPEFASRIQQGVIPNFSRWASFVAGLFVPAEERDAVNRALTEVDEFLFELINSSNFATEANECFLDLALGTAGLALDEQAGDNPLAARAMPLRSLLFCVGPDGRPDPIMEERKIPLCHLHVHWPEAQLPATLQGTDGWAEVDVVECWQRDWSRPTEVYYRRSVFLPSHQNEVILSEWHRGQGSCRFIVFRWSKASGEGWGRGPLFNCLPSMRKCNFAERALLDHTDMAIAGVWSAEEDGVLNPDTVRLEPGTMIPRAPGSRPPENIGAGGDFRIAEFMLEESRGTIRKALYTEQLGNPNKTPMSATEVSQRMAELARAIGAPFGRILAEFAMPVVIRAARILRDRKLVQMPQVDGREIKLIPTSPLAQAQRFEDLDALDGLLARLSQAYGPQATAILTDPLEVAQLLGEKLQAHPRALRPKADAAKLLAGAAQAVTTEATTNGETGGPPPAA